MDLGLRFGAWNEYRPLGWYPRFTQTDGGGTIIGSFLSVAIVRVDATNLGSVSNQADAVEITRLRLVWVAALKTRTPDLFGGPDIISSFAVPVRSVYLSESDHFDLTHGAEITLSDNYTQGTYPDPVTTNLYGTLKLQAVGGLGFAVA